MEFPEPVISVAVEPKTKADQEKWVQLLHVWQKKILHSKCVLMKKQVKLLSPVWVNFTWISSLTVRNREFKVDCNVGKPPQVAYRETIRKAVKAEGKSGRQSGGRGQYGHCWLELIPQEPGAGFEFETRLWWCNSS